jgi:hypothetical protein
LRDVRPEGAGQAWLHVLKILSTDEPVP